ncbi:MAG: hypothetical protein PF961_11760 [Planctomycetota bacterium]|nr:hypothetical protein [Planctomycetota bacterium]
MATYDYDGICVQIRGYVGTSDPINKWDPNGLRAIVAYGEEDAFNEWRASKNIDARFYQWGVTQNREGWYAKASWNPLKDFHSLWYTYSELYRTKQVDLSLMNENEQAFALMVLSPDLYVFKNGSWHKDGDGVSVPEATTGVKAHFQIYPRLNGAVQALGATVEGAVSAGLLVAPEPTMVSKVVGWAGVVHASDNAAAGLNTMIFGEPTQTLTSRAVQGGLQLAGVNEQLSLTIGEYTNAAVGLGTMGYGGYRFLTAPKPLIPNQASIRLVHLTDEAGETGIAASNTLRGNHGIFAVPATVGSESTALQVLRTGLTPDKTTNLVNVPGSAANLFTRPVPLGPYSAWKYFGGVRYAPAGSVNMTTGAYSAGGSIIGPNTLIYGPDVLFWSGVGAAGGIYTYAESENSEGSE